MSSWLTPPLLQSLMDRHAAPLELYARQWSEQADDCVQEAFVALVREPRPPDNVAAWLFRTVRNRAISLRRSADRRRGHERRAAESSANWFHPAIDERLDARQAAEWLGELPESQREAIVLRLWGGLTFAEIAAIAGCSTSTVHRNYESGLAALRDRMENTKSREPSCPTRTP